MTKAKESLISIGERLRKNRKSRHLSQEDVAKHINVDRTTISRYENGVIDIPVSTLIEISGLCGFEPRLFFNWESDGLEELQKLLQDCTDAAKSREMRKHINQTPIRLSENSIDLLMTYALLKYNSAISESTLRSLKEDIVAEIELEQGVKREELLRRLKGYSNKMK